MPSCFIISPIGELGSEIRENADYLRDLLITPVLALYGFDVIRGDHRSEAGQIDIDVIRAVQESDLCIVDVSFPNANVYYEFGRRDETGKPLILLKAKGSDDLPVDVATRRYIEYDLFSPRGLIDAREQLKNFVEPIVRNGFEKSGTGTSLSELAEILKRIERKIDRFESTGGSNSGGGIISTDIPDDVDPIDLLRLALRQKNIPMAEKAMDILSYRMNKHRWLDQVVEQVAILGSIKAGDLLISNAVEFMDNATFHEKVEYLGCLVSNLNRTDREKDNMEFVESICASIRAVSAGEDVDDQIQVFNQLNRLYYGMYVSTEEEIWLEKAIAALKQALELAEKGYLFYNLALCEKERNKGDDMQMALEHVLRCIELDEKENDDHLDMACRLLHDLDDPRLTDYLNRLEAKNPVKAQLLKTRWRH